MKLMDLLNEFDSIDMEAERIGVSQERKRRMADGVEKHGDWLPDCCNRDLFQETLEEIYDSLNYLTMEAIKIRLMQQRAKQKKLDEAR